jgi:hypothetical protein
MTNTSEQIKPATEPTNELRSIRATDKQPTPSAKFTIQATLDGFPIVIEGEGRADSLRALIDRLRAIGAVPPAATPAQAEPTKPAGAPTCPVHGNAMKSGRRGFFCPKKVGDGYCTETA